MSAFLHVRLLVLLVFLPLLLHVCPVSLAASPSLTVYTGDTLHNVSTDLWGIFFEEISNAGVGGLYSQQISNFAFESSTEDYTSWDALPSSASTYLSLSTDRPLTWQNPHALQIQSTAKTASETVGVVNTGYLGISVVNVNSFSISLFAYSASITSLTVSIVDAANYSQIFGSTSVSGLSNSWQRFTANLPIKAPPSSINGALTISWSSSSSLSDSVTLDVVTCYPDRPWHGLSYIRDDLGKLIENLHPSFIRMPGGGYIVGPTLRDRFEWRQSTGPLHHRPGHLGAWGYWSEDAFGIYEYFSFAEQLTDVWGERTRTVWVINPGIGNRDSIPIEHIEWWTRNALDCVEFIMGDTKSQWGAVRAQMGHPEPFHLDYFAIGNENCQFGGLPAYTEIYPIFYKRLKAAYPSLPLIVNCYDKHFDGIFDLYEVHLYPSWSQMAGMGNFFDNYPTSQPIFLSEYSGAGTVGGQPETLRNALSEAIFMSGVENNSHIVKMASYAPLFAKVGMIDWNPNLIIFNSSHSYGTPSYYNQKLFSDAALGTIKGTQQTVRSTLSSVPSSMTADPEPPSLTASVTTAQLSAAYSKTKGGASLVWIIKLTSFVNTSLSVNVSLEGLPTSASFPVPGDLTCLQSPTGNPVDGNTLDEPSYVSLVSSTVNINSAIFSVDVPPSSANVLRVYVATKKEQVERE